MLKLPYYYVSNGRKKVIKKDMEEKSTKIVNTFHDLDIIPFLVNI